MKFTEMTKRFPLHTMVYLKKGSEYHIWLTSFLKTDRECLETMYGKTSYDKKILSENEILNGKEMEVISHIADVGFNKVGVRLEVNGDSAIIPADSITTKLYETKIGKLL